MSMPMPSAFADITCPCCDRAVRIDTWDEHAVYCVCMARRDTCALARLTDGSFKVCARTLKPYEWERCVAACEQLVVPEARIASGGKHLPQQLVSDLYLLREHCPELLEAAWVRLLQEIH